MHDLSLTELANELDRVAEDAAQENRRGDVTRLLQFAASLRHLETVSGVHTMGAVADRIHQYKQALIQANADRDAARADAAKSAADSQRLAELQAAGQILDPSDNAALAEPVPGADAPAPGNGPTDNAGGPADASATVVPPPATDAAGTQPQPPA